MYHLIVIEYRKIIDGKTKKIKEPFLFEAVSLGEIEMLVATVFQTRLKNPRWHTLTALRTLTDVIFRSGTTDDRATADPFFQVTAKFFGESYAFYVPAEDADQAIDRVLDFQPSLEKRYITLVKVTPILGVWHPKSILWQGDFHNRSELLYEAKQRNYDRNQLEVEGTEIDNKAEPVLA